MVATKHCSYGKCNSDSRYNHKPHMKNVSFFHFPDQKKNRERCKRWVQACGREGFTINNVTRFMHICSKHFHGEIGPTNEYPDPISATTSDFQKRKFSNPRRRLIRQSLSPNQNGDMSNAADCQEINSATKTYGRQEKLANRYNYDISAPELPEINYDSLSFAQKTSTDDYQHPSNSSPTSHDKSAKFDLFATPKKGASLTVQHEMKLRNGEGEIDMNSMLVFMESGWFVRFINKSIVIYTIVEDCITSKVVTIELETGLYTLDVYGKKIDITNLTHLPTYVTTTEQLFELLTRVKCLTICDGVKPAICHSASEDLCSVVITDCVRRCANCVKSSRAATKREERQQLRCKTENHRGICAKSRVNFKTTPRHELTTMLQTERYKLKLGKQKLKRALTKFNKVLDRGHQLTSDDNEVFSTIVQNNLPSVKSDNLLMMMITEQLKQANRPKNGRRWHPEIVKWAAYLHQKSASAYDAINGSGFICLPSPSTLYRLSVNFKHDCGFHAHVLENMRLLANIDNVLPHQRYVALIIDEMNIRSNIIYNKFSGDLIGFSKLPETDAIGDTLVNKLNDTDIPEVATNMLALFVRGLTSAFKYSFAHFPSNKLTGQELLQIIWSAIRLLENAGFRVLVVVADGAASNRNFFKLSTFNTGVQYKVKNIYAIDEPRPLYFICDVPHLLKTTRNCLLHSNVMCKPRRMRINDKEMLWSHVTDVYYTAQQTSFRVSWRLTDDHVFLNPRSLMKVRLAAQVLSSRTAAAMEITVGEKASETVKFIRLVNDWFDCLNVSNTFKGVWQRNKNLMPYTSPADQRLCWLRETFLGYLNSWKQQVDELPNFKSDEKKRMFISHETYDGHIITVNSITEVIPFLLGKGAEYVLTSHFQQDVLEQEFSKQRHSGGGNENPNVEQFGWNAKKINAARAYITSKKTGNTIIQEEV